MSTITFTIPGAVLPWARSGARGAQRFTPPKQRNYMEVIRSAASTAMAGAAPIEGPVRLHMVAMWPWPKSMSAKKRGLPSAHRKATKPDVDNIAKLLKDSLNLIVYRDDAQVAVLEAEKRFSDQPGLWVKVEAL